MKGATVTIAIEDGPSWTVRKDDERWCLYDGLPAGPTVSLVLDTATAALLFSRGFTKPDLIDRLRLGGDAQIGEMFAIGLSAFFGR